MSTIYPAELTPELKVAAGRRTQNDQLSAPTSTGQHSPARLTVVSYVNSLRVGNTTRKYILTRLADRVTDDCSCIVAVSELAAEAEITERQVQKHLSALRQAGFISVQKRVRADGSQIASRYVLHGSWDDFGGAGTPFDTIATEGAQTLASDAEIIELDFGQTLPPRAFPKPHVISSAKRQRVFARDGHRCLDCGTSANLTVHHIVPWSRGGTNDESNLCTLCRSCNSVRGTRLPSEEVR